MIAKNHAKKLQAILLQVAGRFLTDSVNANDTHKLLHIFMEG